MDSISDIAEHANSDDELRNLLERIGEPSSDTPCAEIYVPGRVELLGKHTDYAGGSSLTFATSRGFRALATADDRPGLSVTDAVSGESVYVPWALAGDGATPESDWAVYPRAVVRRCVRHFGVPEYGVRVVFSSDLPSAAGMSSSSALLTTVALAVLCITDVSESPEFRSQISSREELAEFLGAVEAGGVFADLPGDEGVGTRGGAQDHTAILCSEPGQIGLYSYVPTRVLERLEFPDDMAFVVCHSGVHARKSENALDDYNRLSELAARVGRAWSEAAVDDTTERGSDSGNSAVVAGATLAETISDPELDESRVIDVIDSIAGDPEDRRRLWHRFAQFHDECTIVLPAAVEALRDCDWSAFAQATSTSQWMAEDWLENQVEETAYLVRSARAFNAAAASAFGAGFGGAVWALVPASEADRFAARWADNYRREYPERAGGVQVFTDRPSSAARWPAGSIAGID